MKLKCNKCNDIIENKNLNKEIWCSCKIIGIFNDYIIYGDNNKLKDRFIT